MNTTLLRQRGIALPVMMMILLMMMVTSIFLLKSVNSTTLMSGNVAYESSLRKAADIGLRDGYTWLRTTAMDSNDTLNGPIPASGYVANFDGKMKPDDTAFWQGSRKFTDPTSKYLVEYVVHRMCKNPGAVPPPNQCMLTTPPAGLNAPVAVGSSLTTDGVNFTWSPQVHYVITSRISGPRGGNVVNQLVVMAGAGT